MKIFITGGRGFVGQHLTKFLLDKGCEVVSVSRSKTFKGISHDKFHYISADTTVPGKWQEEVPKADVIVNLAGVSIFNYWTKKYKQAIYNSRILTTRNLVDALEKSSRATLISTSALGYYGDRGDDLLAENEPVGTDFLAKVCQDWEDEALQASSKGVKVMIARFGVVMDKSGGAMKMMLPAFRFFMGGPLGKGNQYFPWIHMTDLINAIWHLIQHQEVKGVFNFCAPKPIRNRDMAKTIGKLLHRPSFLAVPKFAVQLVMGELGSMVLFSQRGKPEKLEESGFKFQYPDFEGALKEVLS